MCRAELNLGDMTFDSSLPEVAEQCAYKSTHLGSQSATCVGVGSCQCNEQLQEGHTDLKLVLELGRASLLERVEYTDRRGHDSIEGDQSIRSRQSRPEKRHSVYSSKPLCEPAPPGKLGHLSSLIGREQRCGAWNSVWALGW